MIDAREPEIFVGTGTKLVHETGVRSGCINLATRHLIEQILELFV